VPPFKHPSTKIVFEYWASLNGGRPPEARLLDPVAIPKLMPNVLVLNRCFERDGSGEFIHRFAGTGVCDFVGIELTGLPLDKYLSLPLCDERGRPDRVLVFMAVLSTQGFGEASALVETAAASEWIDLGVWSSRGSWKSAKFAEISVLTSALS
jgi:hypothetical protein